MGTPTHDNDAERSYAVKGTGRSGLTTTAIERRADLLARLERWTNWPLTILALALIPILLLPHALPLSSSARDVLDRLDYLIWGVFAADLLAKVSIAPHRLRYLRRHWFDVVIVALPLLRPLRLVRSARTLRLLQTSRAVAAVVRVEVVGRRILLQHGLHYVLLSALVVAVAGGTLVTIFERESPEATIRDLADGMWWAIVTMATVGYGDMVPRTPAGRVIGAVLILVGIAVFGTITANLAAFFAEQRDDNVLREVRSLRDQVRRLEEQLSSEPHQEADT